MRFISCKLEDLRKMVLPIGYEGENDHTRVQVDAGEVFKEYPAAVPSLKVHGPGGTIYPAEVTRDGKSVIWDIKASDCAADGSGEAQFTFTLNNVIVKSCIAKIKVYRSIVGGSTPPDPVQDWLDEAQDVLDDLEAAEVHQPMIGVDGYWYTWDQENEEYTKTETKAQGEDGQQGPAGQDGAPGQDATPALITVNYSDLTFPVAKDTQCYHDGLLYYAKQDIQTSEAWTAAHWQQTTVEEQQRLLLTAIQGFEENCVEYILQKKIIVGENQITSESTASGTGWSGSVANGFTHSSGNTDPLVIAVDTVANAVYIVEFDLTNPAEGAIKAGIGDSPVADTYNGSGHVFVGFIADGGYLKLYPKTTYTGTITNIKLRQEVETGTELTHECKNIVNGKDITDISGFWNTAIGPNALKNNQNGTRNIAEGYCALWKLISGNRNIAIGTYAMPFITEGENNIAIGSDSLYNPARSELGGRSEGCIAIGKAALRSGENTVDNVAIGGAAMSESDLNAEQTTAIGVRAGFSAGNHGVFIGYRAGYQLTVEGNTCIGHEAGFKQYNNGKNNIFIGAGAKPNVAGASASTPKTCSNSIVIGQGAECDGSWQIVIGKQSHNVVKIAGKTINFNQDGTVTWS